MIIDTNKYIYETSPLYKNFCDKVTVNICYSMHCVMVIRTAHRCVMGHEIAWMWQLAGHRPTEKSDKKVFKRMCLKEYLFIFNNKKTLENY